MRPLSASAIIVAIVSLLALGHSDDRSRSEPSQVNREHAEGPPPNADLAKPQNLNPINDAGIPLADAFDYPVGAPDAHGYRVHRVFSIGNPGENWVRSDGKSIGLGDPVASIGDGLVVFAEDAAKGWGNVVIIRHRHLDEAGELQVVDSLYGHLLEIGVKKGDLVARGQRIGSIGRGPHNMYRPQLRVEIRKNTEIMMNRAAFAKTFENYHSPSVFIEGFRATNQDK